MRVEPEPLLARGLAFGLLISALMWAVLYGMLG